MLAALKCLDCFPAGALKHFTDVLSSVATTDAEDIVNVLAYLWDNTAVRVKIESDYTAQNWVAFDADVKAAWSAANP